MAYRSMVCSERQQQTAIMKILRDMKGHGGVQEMIIRVSKVMSIVGGQYLKNQTSLTRSHREFKCF